MGTRGLWGFVEGEAERLTYNHFDSYPDGMGSDVLGFLRAQGGDYTTLTERVRNLHVVDGSAKPTPTEQRRLVDLGTWDDSVSTGSTEEWYALLRNTQGDPEATLKVGYMIEGSGFAQDSLFCEWAYVIDLDAGILEAYKGFQREPHSLGRFVERFEPANTHDFPPFFEGDTRDPSICIRCNGSRDAVGQAVCSGNEWYPIRLVGAWSLYELPTDAQFCEAVDPPDDE